MFTLDKLVSTLNCSIPNARLKLKLWGTYTSYNQNGRYYTLPTVPCFDKNGLWHFENIFFSQYGNLKKTIISLVSGSPSGLTGKEIGTIVRLDPRSFLHHFRDIPGIQREKVGSAYIYFSDNPGTYEQQVRGQQASQRTRDVLSDADAVIILCALIKHHDGVCFEDIMKLPEIRARRISSAVIHDFLDHHDLLKKKAITMH